MTYGNNFNALKIYISHQQREQPRRPPVLAPCPMQVTTLAVTDATLLNDIEWAVVDVETTGLSFKWCRVIDVAAVVLGKGSQRGENDGVGAAPHTAFQTLVNPLPPYLANSPHSSPTFPPVPKRISELTGITPEVPTLRCVLTFLHVRPPVFVQLLSTAPSFSTVAPALSRALQGRVPVGALLAASHHTHHLLTPHTNPATPQRTTLDLIFIS